MTGEPFARGAIAVTIDKDRALNILASLGAQPAVAYHEGGVSATITGLLDDIGLPYTIDAFGNIVARIQGRSSGVTPLAIVAHMDHPGFEAVDRHGDYLVGTALGGVPTSSFDPGVPVQVVLPGGQRLSAATAGRHGEEADRQVLISLGEPLEGRILHGHADPAPGMGRSSQQEIPLPCPVVFDLQDFTLDGDFIRMRAADDLAGCGSILSALVELGDNATEGDVYGVFTRAEEIGLMGARLMAEAGTLPPDTLVVSTESSRTLPGAEQGSGPVIRVGDAGYTFNADAESVLIRAREVLQARPEGFRCQRQLMSGGVCEASAFAVYGYQTTGIAFPLGNYHNAAPEGRIEAEYIHVEDYVGGVELMVEAARCVADRGNTAFRDRLRQVPEETRQRLRDTAA